MKKTLLALLVGVSVTLPAYATPSTLVWIPSTDIQSQEQTHLTFDNYFNDENNFGVYGLTVGLKNAEVGFDYFPELNNDPMFFNAKVSLGKLGNKMPVVAGVYNLGTESTTNQAVKYILTSYSADDGTRFTLGYGVGRKEALGDDNKMVMAGIDKMLNDKWWASVDYQGGDSALGALSFGVSYNFAPNTSVLFGYDIYNNSDFKDTATIQLDINF